MKDQKQSMERPNQFFENPTQSLHYLRRLRSTTLFKSGLSCLFLLSMCSTAHGASSAAKERKLVFVNTPPVTAERQLDRFVMARKSDDLTLSINNSSRREWRVGESIKFHVRSNDDCALQVIYIDSNGVGRLFQPGSVAKNKRNTFPQGVDFLTVEPPLGQDKVYAICSRQALPRLVDLPVPSNGDMVEQQHMSSMATSYLQLISQHKKLSVDRIKFTVKGRDQQLALNSQDIVSYYTVRSRTISRPKLDLNVKFAFRSAQITPDGARLLDEIGLAMNDSKLTSAYFELNGHTDDIGSDAYNMELSTQRASAVGEYLKSNHGVPADRVVVRGFGESEPKVNNDNDQARAENRRVEFKLTREF